MWGKNRRWHEPAAWQAAPPLTTLRWAPATHEQPDWPAINAALANSSVVLLVEFWKRWAPPLQLQRTDAGAHWLVIASADYGQRAQIGDGTHAVVAWDEHGRQQRIRLQVRRRSARPPRPTESCSRKTIFPKLGSLNLITTRNDTDCQHAMTQGLYLKGRVHVHSGDYIQYVVSPCCWPGLPWNLL